MVQVVGWLTLMFGVSFSALIGLIVWAFATGMAAFITFGVMSLMTLGVFLLLRKGGQKLSESGDDTRDLRREQALFALAANHGGALQAMQAARALDMPMKEADEFMTRLAKRRQDVDVELGDEGEIFYTFGGVVAMGPGGVKAASSWGHAGAQGAQRVRVGAHEASSAPSARAPSARAADEIRQKNAIDAEFESIEEEQRSQNRR